MHHLKDEPMTNDDILIVESNDILHKQHVCLKYSF